LNDVLLFVEIIIKKVNLFVKKSKETSEKKCWLFM